MSDHSPLVAHDHIVLTYPKRNRVSTKRVLIERPIVVLSVRDLLTDPLRPSEFFRRPLVRRGRWLVYANDIISGGKRQFYLAASEEFYTDTTLRIALYRKGIFHEPFEIVSEPYAATYADLVELNCKLRQLLDYTFTDLEFRVTCDTVSLFRAA